MNRRNYARIASASLLGSASILSLTSAAHAHDVLFSSAAQIPKGPIEAGRETVLGGGTVQIRLNSGAIASFVDAAQFSIRTDGGVDLRSGSVTIVGTDGETVIHMPEGVRGLVSSGSTGMFTANDKGARGSTTAGSVAITGAGATKIFTVGQFWTAGMGRAPDRVIAGIAAAVPGATGGPVRPLREGGIVAAAENGIPVALGEALAAAGARGDIVAAARRIQAFDGNTAIATFPTGDYSLLVAYAAQATSPFGGGTAFNGASADIIRTYFQYLAAGNPGGSFRTAYAGILVNYLDLVRSGVLPSTFRGATQAQLDAYLAFIGRTEGFGALSPANKQLLDAYLAFLSTGGSADAFGGSVTNLTTAFLNFVRGGGQPAAFTQASASVVAQYLAIVQSGGLKTNLTPQNQALLTAYLSANGIGFVQTNATALAAFVAYLNTGGLPSGYTALPPATIRAYLETLETTGLFDSALGNQAAFLRTYLTFLRGGGTADQFNALPINVARVNAAALTVYVDYLLGGGIPSAYTALTQSQIRAYLDQLTAVGQFNALLGSNAAFLTEYYAYLKTGADADTFAGLPTVDVNAYANALTVFAAYLRAGNLPSGYATLTAQQIRSYLTALQVSGRLALLGSDATLLNDYLTYIRAGGAPDAFGGLPIVTYQSYAAALSTYFAFLNGGGLPSNYTALTQAQIRLYLDALSANGQLALLGANSAFYSNYLAFLAGGGAPDAFTGLPIITYQSYAVALNAYFAFLNGGGLPSGYTALTQVQIRGYLDALKAAGQINALLGTNASFYTDYLAFLVGGGAADAFTGLPIVTFQSYATALNAYYAFLLGGGLPSAYTALTQAQIRAYLDALSSANQLGSLLGANAAFFSNYLAYLATGGNPNAYSGLPSSTYGQYASALTAYFAYLDRGGLPSGYTVLTQAQIREYLNVLQANGQLTALLGTSATFFRNYLTFLAGGGAPDAFTELPIVTFQNYATALNAYYAFLAGGGLPASYGALTQAQIRSYLDALQAAGQVNALLGANASFFTSYLTYLAGGGVPDRFQGLPAFVTYEAALRTYYTFLQGGGRPSAYSALTQAQIVAYIQALDAAGLIALRLTAAEAAFLRDYATYVASGANADQFAALPINQGPTVPVVVQGLANAPRGQGGGTNTLVSGGIGKAFTSAVNGDSVVTITGNNLTALTGSSIATAMDTTSVEARTVDNTIAIARWGTGTWRAETGGPRTILANEGLHFVWGTPATALPTTGSAIYGLVTATSPTVDGGAVEPGTFLANMALNFATKRIGFDSRITIGGVVYGFSTAGGTAAPSLGLVGEGGRFNSVGTTANFANSNGLVNGFLSGTGGTYAGLIYQAVLPIGNVSGSAIFGRGQAEVALPAITYLGAPPSSGGLTQTPYAYVGGLPTTGLSLRAIYPAATSTTFTTYNGVAITQASGGGLDRTGGVTPGSQDIVRGTARNLDVAGDARVLVGRWLDGGYTRGTTASTLTANQSLHYAALTPVTFNIPYLGRVDYTLLAATQPTFAGGQTGQGVFDARMSILFSSAPKVALEGTIRMPETTGTVTYGFTTPGGVANPSQAAAVGDLSGGAFNVTASLSGTGLACATGASCTLRFEGGLSGADPLRAGGIYYTAQGGLGAATSITGAAAFTGSWNGSAQSFTTVTNRQFTSLAPGNTALNVNQGTYDVDATGRVVGLTNFNGLFDRLGTAQIAQSGATASGNLGWTRWSNGSLDLRRLGGVNSVVLNANQGYQILHGAAATALPTTGTVTYTLTGGTNPTDHAGTLAPGTLGTGTAAVSFGTTSKLAFDFTTTIGGNSYNLFTTGKIAGITNSEITLSSGAFNNIIGPGGNVTGGSCTATQCRPIWGGFLAGAGGTEIGLNYQVQNTSTQLRFGGIAAFTRDAVQGGGAGVNGQTGTFANQLTYTYAAGSLVEVGSGNVTYDAGALKSYVALGGAVRNSGVIQERGRLSDVIGWARWTGDTAGPLVDQPASRGLHIMSGTPTTVSTLPASGTVQYTMVGGTTPTLGTGTVPGGTMTGTLGVAFGALPRVGFDLTTTVGTFGWRVQTTGGSANPSASSVTVGAQLSFSGTFNTNVGTVTPTTSTSCVSGCNVTVGGQFYGAGASHIGVSVNVLDTGPAGVTQASGIGIFSKSP